MVMVMVSAHSFISFFDLFTQMIKRLFTKTAVIFHIIYFLKCNFNSIKRICTWMMNDLLEFSGDATHRFYREIHLHNKHLLVMQL